MSYKVASMKNSLNCESQLWENTLKLKEIKSFWYLITIKSNEVEIERKMQFNFEKIRQLCDLILQIWESKLQL